jgi:tRNA 2-selenouridine synthase
MMVEKLSVELFLEKAQNIPVIDVRSPAEFEYGHIPGAFNIPLFSDLERADVGRLYHQAGKDKAVGRGLEIAGPRMKNYVDEAKKLARNNELLIYCWRGGMRSESMAWLFSTAGITASVLENGYKSYRKYNRTCFKIEKPMIIIGGNTGSGKTKLLHKLSRSGCQVIDLEALANHRGSVFGSLGMPGQPSNAHFENLLGTEWRKLDPDRPVFMEDESFNIGRDSIPKCIYEKMQYAPLFLINMTLEERVDRLYEEYAHYPPEVLKKLIQKLNRRLGGANTKYAIEAVEDKRLRHAIHIALRYYDKAYNFDVGKRNPDRVFNFADDGHEDIIAQEMIKKSAEIYPENEPSRIPGL